MPLTLADRLFVRDIVGGPSRVRIFDLDGKPQGSCRCPRSRPIGEIEPLPDGDVLFDVSTYLRPRYYARWDAGHGQERRRPT